jgi:hypothetical protein
MDRCSNCSPNFISRDCASLRKRSGGYLANLHGTRRTLFWVWPHFLEHEFLLVLNPGEFALKEKGIFRLPEIKFGDNNIVMAMGVAGEEVQVVVVGVCEVGGEGMEAEGMVFGGGESGVDGVEDVG